MPIYEYRCSSCHRTFEVIQKVDEAPPKSCTYCSGPVEKLISRASFQLKGGGWFNSDYGAPKAAGSSDKDGASAEKTQTEKTSGDSTGAAKGGETSAPSGAKTDGGGSGS